MIGLIVKPKKPRWILESSVKHVREIYQNKWVAILHDDCEFTVMPSWWARLLTVKRFVKLIQGNRLYIARRNPYR